MTTVADCLEGNHNFVSAYVADYETHEGEDITEAQVFACSECDAPMSEYPACNIAMPGCEKVAHYAATVEMGDEMAEVACAFCWSLSKYPGLFEPINIGGTK